MLNAKPFSFFDKDKRVSNSRSCVEPDFRSFKNFGYLKVKEKLTPEEKAFKDFFISYPKSINKAYNRTGSLFQAKFKKKEITDNSYFTAIIQYIHVNSLKAKLCHTYDEYKYSSYKAITDTGITKIKRAEVLEWFGNKEVFIKVHVERKLEIEKIEQFIFS